MTTSDWISLSALFIALLSLGWNIFNHLNDRSGKLKVEGMPVKDPFFVTRLNSDFTPTGTVYKRTHKRLEIVITNTGRENRTIKQCSVKTIAEPSQINDIGGFHGKILSPGELSKQYFHPVDKIKDADSFIINVVDSLGKEYSSRKFKLKEF